MIEVPKRPFMSEEASAGRILIGGTDIRDVTLESLRRNIAFVSQDITIFDDNRKEILERTKRGKLKQFQSLI